MGADGRVAATLDVARRGRRQTDHDDAPARRPLALRGPSPAPDAAEADAVAGGVLDILDQRRNDREQAEQTLPGLPEPLLLIAAPLLAAIRAGELRVTEQQARPLLALLGDLAADLAEAVAGPGNDARGAVAPVGLIAVSDVISAVLGVDVRRWLAGNDLLVSRDWIEAHPIVVDLPPGPEPAGARAVPALAGPPGVDADQRDPAERDLQERERAEQEERERAEREGRERKEREERERAEREEQERKERERAEQEERERAEREEQERKEGEERERAEQEEREREERERKEREERERAEREERERVEREERERREREERERVEREAAAKAEAERLDFRNGNIVGKVLATRAEAVVAHHRSRVEAFGKAPADFEFAAKTVKEALTALRSRAPDKPLKESPRYGKGAVAAVEKLIGVADRFVAKAEALSRPVEPPPAEEAVVPPVRPKLPPIEDAAIDAEFKKQVAGAKIDLTQQTDGYGAKLRLAVRLLLEARQIGVAEEIDGAADGIGYVLKSAGSDRAAKQHELQVALLAAQAKEYRERFEAALSGHPDPVVKLLRLVKAAVDDSAGKGGTSSNFASDRQLGVKGTFPPEVVAAAGAVWRSVYRFSAADQKYRGPSSKGDLSMAAAAKGLPQANFEAPFAVGYAGKANVHVDVGRTVGNKATDVYTISVGDAALETGIKAGEIVRMAKYYGKVEHTQGKDPLGVYRGGKTWFSAHDVARLKTLHASVPGKPWNH